jgi:hypothetical protein
VRLTIAALGRKFLVGGVAAMAGSLDLGHPVNFALILNGPGNLAQVEQQMVEALTTHPGG